MRNRCWYFLLVKTRALPCTVGIWIPEQFSFWILKCVPGCSLLCVFKPWYASLMVRYSDVEFTIIWILVQYSSRINKITFFSSKSVSSFTKLNRHCPAVVAWCVYSSTFSFSRLLGWTHDGSNLACGYNDGYHESKMVPLFISLDCYMNLPKWVLEMCFIL